MKTVSIFGCGWLGFPLAKKLVENGYVVKGSSTSEDKKELFEKYHIKHFTIDYSSQTIPTVFLESENWVIAFPPKSKRTNGEWYKAAIEKLAELAVRHATKKIILLSSTSVYPDLAEKMEEDRFLNEENSGSPILWQSEQAILNLKNNQHFVLRLGGLAGADRFLARHFSGKSELKNGQHPANLLHQTDAVNCIFQFIDNDFESGIYNVCSPTHPTREELYTHDCKRFGMPLPFFAKNSDSGKIIGTEKIEKIFRFEFADPKAFEYSR